MFLIQKLLNKIIYRHLCLLTHVWYSGFRNYLENKYTSNTESIRKIDKRALILLHLKNNRFKKLLSNRDNA